MKYVFSPSDIRRYRFPTHTNDLIMDRSEARCSEVFVVILQPGEAPPPHRHDDAEQLFYILEGAGLLTVGEANATCRVRPGDLARIPVSTTHSIRADGDRTLKYLAVDCFPNGHSHDEPTWDSHVQALCRRQGWDFSQVRQ